MLDDGYGTWSYGKKEEEKKKKKRILRCITDDPPHDRIRNENIRKITRRIQSVIR